MSSLVPRVHDLFFFDDAFEEMDREIARMHHDIRGSLRRLNPPPFICNKDSEDKVNQFLKRFGENVVIKDDGSQEFQMHVDVHSFKPEEIEITTKDGSLSISANHEEKTDTSSVVHKFSRSYTLPEDVDPDTLVSSLSRDGILTVKAPLAIDGPSPAKKIAIEQEK